LNHYFILILEKRNCSGVPFQDIEIMKFELIEALFGVHSIATDKKKAEE